MSNMISNCDLKITSNTIEQNTITSNTIERNAIKRAILNTTIDAIISINTKGIIEMFNPSAEKLFGYNLDEVIGKNVQMLMSHNYNHNQYLECYLRTGIKKIIGYGREVIGKKKSGEIFNMDLSIIEVNINDKKMFTATIRDITKRIKEKEELEQALTIKNNFLAKMSHELRTPMNGIIGMSNILLTMNLTQEQKDMVSTISESGEILLNVVNDILDFSKIEAKKQELEYKEFNLKILIEQIIDMMFGHARLKFIDLGFLLANDIPIFLVGDNIKIRQILINIINNAIKFTNNGYVFINVKLINIVDNKCNLLIEVQDTGIGILEENISKLFQPFTQIDETITRKYGGSGLGLVIAKELAVLMNGDITLSSIYNKGTTFNITLQVDLQIDNDIKLNNNISLFKTQKIIVFTYTKLSKKILKYYFKYLGISCIFIKDTQDFKDFKNFKDLKDITHIICEFNNINNELLIEIKNKHKHIKIIGIKYIEHKYKNIEYIDYWINKPLKCSSIYSIFDVENYGKKYYKKILPNINKAKTNMILIAEDNMINQKVLMCMIKKCGFEADVASNGKEVIELMKIKQYNLIFMDCHMPEMDGFECTRLIRLNEINSKSHVKIVALTGGVNDKQKCFDCGMDIFLSKPVKPNEIWKIINEV